MLKTTFKIFMLFLLMVVVALSTGIATYNITKNIIEDESSSVAQASALSETRETSQVRGANVRNAENNREKFEYYLVCLDGENLEIYVYNDGEKEFLYSREVYVHDLSENDLEMLNRGVKLESVSELTGFIENFTS